MPRLTILTLASACVLAATPILAQSAPTTPPAQPAVVTPAAPEAPATTVKPSGRSGCGGKAKQVMS